MCGDMADVRFRQLLIDRYKHTVAGEYREIHNDPVIAVFADLAHMLPFGDTHCAQNGAKCVYIADKIVVRYISDLFSDTETECTALRNLAVCDFQKVTDRGYRFYFI